jgi:hypothetical protein
VKEIDNTTDPWSKVSSLRWKDIKIELILKFCLRFIFIFYFFGSLLSDDTLFIVCALSAWLLCLVFIDDYTVLLF